MTIEINVDRIKAFFERLIFVIKIRVNLKEREFYKAMLDFTNKDELFEKLKRRICKTPNYQLTEEDRKITCEWFDAHERLKTAKKAIN